MPAKAVKSAKAPKPDPAIAATVDQIGRLEAELAPFKSKLVLVDLLRRSLRALYAEFPAGQVITAQGEEYVAILGPCSTQTIVNVARAAELLGPERFAALATLPISKIETALPPDKLIDVLKSAATGPRSLTVSRKA